MSTRNDSDIALEVIVLETDDENEKINIEFDEENDKNNNNKQRNNDIQNNYVDSEPTRCGLLVQKCGCNFIWLLLLISTVLWALSEAGVYGEGILRNKNVNETCKYGTGRVCAPGLECAYGTCKAIEQNVTWIIENCESPPPPMDCPPQQVTVEKIVSYFDYREYPNRFIIPNKNEIAMPTIQEVDYGACKEICSRNSTCHAICYYANTRECHLRSSSGINPPIDAAGQWTCGVKIAF